MTQITAAVGIRFMILAKHQIFKAALLSQKLHF